MTEFPDIKACFAKVARGEAFSEDELVAVLKMAEHLLNTSEYLASCHAATAEGLPKSASKTSRERMASICLTAAKALKGDSSGLRFAGRVEATIKRCEAVVQSLAQSKA